MRDFTRLTILLCLLAGALLPGRVQAQSALSPDKVYVQLDRTYFAAGETIWMKGYVEQIVPVPDSSRYLYVELLDGNKGNVAYRHKIRYGADGFAGYIDLPEEMAGGHYLLRAYTQWQLNWPEEWMFHTPIDIYDGTEPAPPAKDETIDISFYPEGGRYFAGEYASIGFKVMGPDGRSLPFEGQLVDDLGNPICDARTVHAGMGLLGFTPQEGRSYRLVAGTQSWNLPPVSTEGATLQVRRVGDHFAIHTINRTGGEVFLQTAFFGDRTGLQKYMLTDAAGQVLAERAVFFDNGEMAARLDVSWTDPDYVPRRRWDIHLQLPTELAADSAEVSVSVVRNAFLPYQQEENLVSYMLLGSEVRGHIENPGYYFDPAIPASTRLSHLDLLLLIQGWTYYDAVLQIPALPYAKEKMQTLHGEIRSFFGGKPRKYTLALMAIDQDYSQVTSVKDGYRFYTDSLDFPENTLFIIHVDNDGARKRYYPVLQEDFAPKLPMGKGRQARIVPRIPRPQEQADVSTFEPSDVLVDTIQTAVIQDVVPQIRTPFGTSDLPGITKREELSFYDNRTLLDYILMKNPNLFQEGDEVYNMKTGTINKNGESFETVALYVNGFRMTWDFAETILLSEVEKLSVTTNLTSDALLARSYGGIVLAELREGAEPASLLKQGNTLAATPLGWQRPKAFYNPVYDRRRSLSIPDRRNTVYWNPSVQVGKSPVDLTLMTEDRADGPYFLRVEGRTSDGRWISETKILTP